MSSPIKKLLGQTAIYGLSVIVGRTLNFFLVPLYTSELVFGNPKDYGVVSELYAWVAFLIVLLPLGMETAFFKFFNDKKEQKSFIFQNGLLSIIGFNLLFFLCISLFNQPIANAMLYGDHPEYILLMAGIVCVDAIASLPLAKLRAEEKAFQFAGIQFASIGINIGLNLILLLGFFDKSNPEQGIMMILIANLISALVKPLLLLKQFAQIRLEIDFTLIKQMIKYSFPLILAGFAGIINETLDRILLKQLLYHGDHSLAHAEAQVGIYSACYKLAMFITIFLQAYRYAAEPFFFANAKEEDRKVLYGKIMNYFMGTVCAVFLLVSLNLQIFKYFIPSEAYWVGLGVVPILLMANVFLGVYYNQSIWYKLSGQTRFGAYIAVSGACLTVALNLLFIPHIGFWASAWATLAVYAFQMIASYFLGQKHYPIRYNLRKFFLYLSAAIVLFFIAYFLNIEEGYLRFFTHNTFVLLFVALVFYMEKPQRKSV